LCRSRSKRPADAPRGRRQTVWRTGWICLAVCVLDAMDVDLKHASFNLSEVTEGEPTAFTPKGRSTQGAFGGLPARASNCAARDCSHSFPDRARLSTEAAALSARFLVFLENGFQRCLRWYSPRCNSIARGGPPCRWYLRPPRRLAPRGTGGCSRETYNPILSGVATSYRTTFQTA